MIKEDFWANSINIDIIAVNGQFVSIYRKHIIKITVTDTSGMTRIFNVVFIIIDIKRYKVILSYL